MPGSSLPVSGALMNRSRGGGGEGFGGVGVGLAADRALARLGRCASLVLLPVETRSTASWNSPRTVGPTGHVSALTGDPIAMSVR